MLPVEPGDPIQVLLRVGRALALVAVHHVLVILRPLSAKVRERRLPQRVRSGAVREDEVLEPMGPVRRDVLDGECDAPGLPEQVKVAADLEVPDEVVQLGDKERRREKARGLVVHASGLARAELVVQDDRLAVRLVQIGVREQVPVGYARSAVQNHEGPRSSLGRQRSCTTSGMSPGRPET